MSAYEKDMIDQYEFLTANSDNDIDELLRNNPDEFEALCAAWRATHEFVE